ncbi:MAG: ATP-binding protein [Pseudomonadota bacterium]
MSNPPSKSNSPSPPEAVALTRAAKPRVPVKWRPALGLVTFVVIAALIALPLIGLVFFRLYENQLIRETEGELIAQTAAMRAVIADRLGYGPQLPDISRPRFEPMEPAIDLSKVTILPPRPNPVLTQDVAAPELLAVGAEMTRIIQETRRITLAGIRIVDAKGVIIDRMRDDTGMSLAHVPEVARALGGEASSVLRRRITQGSTPPLYSISRGTRLRVFVAMPVIVDGQVVAAIHASRTPNNIVKHLYKERVQVFAAALTLLAAALAMGFFFLRMLTRPVNALIGRTRAIARGEREAIRPLSHHGTHEIATLTQSFLDMASALSDRSDAIATFAKHVTHELKSPLTAIQGASELLREQGEEMTEADRARFLGSIEAETTRLTQLLNRLRDLAQAEVIDGRGTCAFDDLVASLRQRYPGIALTPSAPPDLRLTLSEETAGIVLTNLLENASAHGAAAVTITAAERQGHVVLRVVDNGSGVSPGNAERIFEPFFTTRRKTGGTGMGLGIVRAMLRAQGGDIALVPSEAGATFEIALPADD